MEKTLSAPVFLLFLLLLLLLLCSVRLNNEAIGSCSQETRLTHSITTFEALSPFRYKSSPVNLILLRIVHQIW